MDIYSILWTKSNSINIYFVAQIVLICPSEAFSGRLLFSFDMPPSYFDRSQGKQNFSFIAASEISLVLEDFRGQSFTLLNNYLGESYHGVTYACFSSK